MKRKIVNKIVLTAVCLSMTFGACGMTSIAASSTQSQDKIGGQYAYGSCSYSQKTATSITSHNVGSYKYAKLRASYRSGNEIKPSNVMDNTSTSAGVNAQAVATISSDSLDYFLGCIGSHTVTYGGITWTGSTSVGGNYYGW